MDTCSRMRKLLGRVLRPEMLPGHAQTHLDGCPDCRQWWQRELEARRELASLSGGHAPPEVERVVMARIWQERVRSGLRAFHLRVAAVGTAAVAVTAAALLYFGTLQQTPGSNSDLAHMLRAHAAATGGGVTGDSGFALVGEVEGLF